VISQCSFGALSNKRDKLREVYGQPPAKERWCDLPRFERCMRQKAAAYNESDAYNLDSNFRKEYL
jgi:hypothetical protein